MVVIFRLLSANLNVEPFVVVSHVVHSGREGSLQRRDRDGIQSKVLHQKLRIHGKTGAGESHELIITLGCTSIPNHVLIIVTV